LKNKEPAFIFDFGGVLIDWDPRYLYRKLFDENPEAMERFLKEVDFYSWNARQDEGRTFTKGVEELCERFPHYRDLIQAYDRRWDESIAGPIPGTLAILRTLREMSYPLYGLSNWSVEKFELVQHKYEMFGWFEMILVSGEVKVIKPNPRIFGIMLERIERNPEECLLVDDSIQNVEVARQLGFQTIHFRSPEQLLDELRQRRLLTPDSIYGIIQKQ
jgi:2-haloacid dehalogenase